MGFPICFSRIVFPLSFYSTASHTFPCSSLDFYDFSWGVMVGTGNFQWKLMPYWKFRIVSPCLISVFSDLVFMKDWQVIPYPFLSLSRKKNVPHRPSSILSMVGLLSTWGHESLNKLRLTSNNTLAVSQSPWHNSNHLPGAWRSGCLNLELHFSTCS